MQVTKKDVDKAKVEWETAFDASRVAAKAADNATRVKAAAAKAEKNAAKRHMKLRKEYEDGK